MSTKTKSPEQIPDGEIVPAHFANLLKKHGSVEKAVKALHRNLNAKKSHFDVARGEWIAEDDGPTQVKAGAILLSYAIGEPVKRQQILTGKMPEMPPSRDQLRQSIDRKIAALVEQPDAKVTDLLAARKSLAEQEESDPAETLTEEDLVARARRIHGVAPTEPKN